MNPFTRHCGQHVPVRSAACLILYLVFGSVSTILAADFVVVTQTFDGDAKQPYSQNRTIFHNDQVFDFIEDGEEITVMDKALGRFVLLDRRRKVRAEVTTDQVLGYAQQIKAWAATKKDPLLQFYVDPRFEVVKEDKQLQLKATPLTYEVTGVSASSDVVQQYREFSDWFARLNSAVNPGSQLPFPRLVVNNHLARGQLVPSVVRLSIAPQPRFKNEGIVLRAQHDYAWELADEDLAKLDEARQLLVKYRLVTLPDYRKPDLPAGR